VIGVPALHTFDLVDLQAGNRLSFPVVTGIFGISELIFMVQRGSAGVGDRHP